MTIPEIRSSQIITTYGPGMMVDLPDSAVIISGPDHWDYDTQSIASHMISEPRLALRVKEFFRQNLDLNLESVDLRRPPKKSDITKRTFGETQNSPCVTAWEFPEWFVVQKIEEHKGVKCRRLVRKHHLRNGKYDDPSGKSKCSVVPIRFVRACNHGHVDDIDWVIFVHQGMKESRHCVQAQQGLFLEERGNTGVLSDIYVRCNCGASRSLAQAQSARESLGRCNGRRPWLGANTREECNQISKLLVRGSSNSYFSQTLSSIAIPDQGVKLTSILQEFIADLDDITDPSQLQLVRKFNPLFRTKLEPFSNESIFNALKQSSDVSSSEDVKVAEFRAFIDPSLLSAEDKPNADFLVSRLSNHSWRQNPLLSTLISDIILVKRLREVVAQVGFTRFEMPSKGINGEIDLDLDVKVARVADRRTNIIPAYENRGEGFFIQFSADAVEAWAQQQPVKDRAMALYQGYCWNEKKKDREPNNFFGVAYYMIHTLSHLLIQQLSMECGYPASSIRERIYCNAEAKQYGILLYTGSSDADGTLGGLVESAKSVVSLLEAALDTHSICSSDPVCSHNKPQESDPHHWLHGSACHCCTHLPETCCEQMNRFLDRALVVNTIEGLGCEFFRIP